MILLRHASACRELVPGLTDQPDCRQIKGWWAILIGPAGLLTRLVVPEEPGCCADPCPVILATQGDRMQTIESLAGERVQPELECMASQKRPWQESLYEPWQCWML